MRTGLGRVRDLDGGGGGCLVEWGRVPVGYPGGYAWGCVWLSGGGAGASPRGVR